jgi:hypothetical protein
MWKVLACSLVIASVASNVLIPSLEFKLETGKTMVIQAVTLKDRYFVESKLGCDVTCSQMCLDLSRNYALAQCFKYCGCEKLVVEKSDSLQRPQLEDIMINARQDVRIDFDLPEGPNDSLTIEATLPSGSKNSPQKYSIEFQPNTSRNGKDHLSVDLPGGPENTPELDFSTSESHTGNSSTSKLEWEFIDPQFNGNFESTAQSSDTEYTASNVVTAPGLGFEAGVKQNYNINPQEGEITFNEEVYGPEFIVQHSGTETVSGTPGKGAANVKGTISWDFDKNKHPTPIPDPVEPVPAPASYDENKIAAPESSGVSTLMFQGFFFTVVGAVIYRFVTASRSVAPASESLLSHYQRL